MEDDRHLRRTDVFDHDGLDGFDLVLDATQLVHARDVTTVVLLLQPHNTSHSTSMRLPFPHSKAPPPSLSSRNGAYHE